MGKRAKVDNSKVLLTLGLRHSSGQDYSNALEFFGKAAEGGDTAAQCALGAIYISGKGVPQDFTLAHMWFNLAASGAGGEAQQIYAATRDLLASKMTLEQIAEAQRMARDSNQTHCSPKSFAAGSGL